jgi:hypothetical protein
MEIIDREHQQLIWKEVANSAFITTENLRAAILQYERYSVMLRTKLFIDGDMWCCLYGDNIQDGVCGFGNSPHLAMMDFDRAFYKSIKINENYI